MSYYRGSVERNSSKYNHRDNSLQKKRENEKIRRQQQYNTEETADEPVFSQPRKIASTERQDSLTRNIASVLGDPGVVGGILFREPNIWLGTTRSGQGQNQTGQPPKENNISSSGMLYSSDKGGGVEQNQRPGYASSSKPLAHSEGSRTSDIQRPGDRKHNPRSKHSRIVNKDNSNSARSVRYDRSNAQSSNSANWSYNDSADRPSRMQPSNEDSAYSVRASSDRDRISSVDSDLSGVENILKEMVELPPSITEIKTPIIGSDFNKFSFGSASQKRKPEGPERSIGSAPSDPHDDAGSDSSSSSDEEPNNDNSGWTLSSLMQSQAGVDSRTKNAPSRDSEHTNVSTLKEKKRKSSGGTNSQSPKMPHLDSSKDDRIHPLSSSKIRQKTSSSSRSSQSPRSRPAAPAEPNVKPAVSKRTPNSSGNYQITGKSSPSTNDKKFIQTPLNKAPSNNNELKHSGSSSSSSDSSSSGESDDESDSNDEDANNTSKMLQQDNYAKNSTLPSNNNTSWGENRRQDVVNAPNDSRDMNPVRDKRSVGRPSDVHHNRSPATVKREISNADEKPRLYPSLVVKIRTSLRTDSINGLNVPSKSSSSKHQASHSSKAPTAKKRQRSMVSVGSETEQPVRRTRHIQVAVADASTDWKDESHAVETKPTVNPRDFRDQKRRREDRHWKQPKLSPRVERRGSTSANNYDDVPDTNNCQSTFHRNQDSPNSSNRPSASVVLPDSSLPGEQERIETSDWYMREGKRMKHEGDGMVDSRSGRTRLGEALTRALSYFEASLFFIMSGYVMENESPEDRMESSSPNSHCPTNMYQQTLPLLNFVLKMRPRVEQEDHTFKQITISCLRCQSFLYFRIFHLKKDIAISNSELLTKQFESLGKSGQTHSPWRNTNAAPNVLSPMSPAVPSPFTHHGPSPASSNSEQVSSSTQAGRMTPTSHSNYNLPQKTYDIYRQHHAIMCNLLQAHEKWDLAEGMLEEHADFFRNIDALCNITLTFHSSLRDVFHYHRMVLRQLRALMNGSPST